MKKSSVLSFLVFYLIVFAGVLVLTVWGSRAITVMSERAPLTDRTCIIVDAGHGGVDGGTTSCTGVLESGINLQIAQRLNDLFRLLGYDTRMTRTEDVSLHTEGQTIAAKKASDLRYRVQFVNQTPSAILVSIHQNYFSDSRYSGAQVFYAETPGSDKLAGVLQSALVSALNPGSNRQSKPAEGIYLMEHIATTGVLVECGFLSNPREEACLRDPEYQKDLCCVIVCAVSNYLSAT